ncbi:hypothetical protein ACMD2_25544 [Ananas comosus]|uniref:Uncharacterized protein n=1 Tax=Ananas comosus TaxID=4615 RepID=A0A199UVZ7_ANACO|nr:hypothetical protein ACMD2_25544 [Ananas comosus]
MVARVVGVEGLKGLDATAVNVGRPVGVAGLDDEVWVRLRMMMASELPQLLMSSSQQMMLLVLKLRCFLRKIRKSAN